MAKNKNLRYQLCREVEKKWMSGKGQSKRSARAKAKASGRDTPTSIHSKCTKENYMQSCKSFASWVKENHPDAYHSMEAAKAHVPEWLKTYQNSGSRMGHAAALAKAYGMDGGKSWGVALGHRPLNGIHRGRVSSSRSTAWASNHSDVAEAFRCCGLRRSEAQALRGADVYQRADGQWCVHVVSGKGGRSRESVIWSAPGDTAGLDWLRAAAAAAGPDGRVFGNVPDMVHANIHSFRAEYAGRLYQSVSSGGGGSGDMYRPMNGHGEWDKGVLAVVSRNLGHGDKRCSTIYYNYLSYGIAED